MEDSETLDNDRGREADRVSFVARVPYLDEGKSFSQKLVGNESPSEAAAGKVHSPSRLVAHLDHGRLTYPVALLWEGVTTVIDSFR